MGQEGETDRVYRKYYQSSKITLDTGNLFRGEEPRPEKSKVLSMNLKRDPNAPEIPKDVLFQILDKDEQVQTLLRSKQDLKAQLEHIKDDPEHDYNRVAIGASYEALCRALNRRRTFLRDHAKRDFKTKYFENPNKVRSQYPSLPLPQKAGRSQLVGALYPTNELGGSALVAIKLLIAHCTSGGECVERKKSNHTPQLQPNNQDLQDEVMFKEPLSSIPQNTRLRDISFEPEGCREENVLRQDLLVEQDMKAHRKRDFTEHDTQRLVRLKEISRLTWDEIVAQFPGWSEHALGRRYKKFKTSNSNEGLSAGANSEAMLLGSVRPNPNHPKSRMTPEDDELLVRLKEDARLTWREITTYFPGRSKDTLGSRYRALKLSEKPGIMKRNRSYTPEENQRLLELKKKSLSWPEIVEYFPGRSPDAVKHHYYSLLKHAPSTSQLTPRKRGISEISASESKRCKTAPVYDQREETESDIGDYDGENM